VVYDYDSAPTDPAHGGTLTADMARERIDELVAERERLRIALDGIIDHWWEFGDMMIENKDDYGFSERIDLASKLVK
jgi:hypothetical protein